MTDADNRQKMLSYVAFHKPVAKLELLDEKMLVDLEHEDVIQLLLQDVKVRNIILDKIDIIKDKEIDGIDLDELNDKMIKKYWKIKGKKHR